MSKEPMDHTHADDGTHADKDDSSVSEADIGDAAVDTGGSNRIDDDGAGGVEDDTREDVGAVTDDTDGSNRTDDDGAGGVEDDIREDIGAVTDDTEDAAADAREGTKGSVDEGGQDDIGEGVGADIERSSGPPVDEGVQDDIGKGAAADGEYMHKEDAGGSDREDSKVSVGDGDRDSTVAEAVGETVGRRSDQTTMKRTSYYGLVITAIVGIAIGSFFAGYFVFTTDDPGYVTADELESKIDEALQERLKTIRQDPVRADAKLLVSTDDDPMIGDPDAPVTIVEFSDFECPFCARFHQQTLPSIMQNYIDTGMVNMVYRDFPLDSIHPNAIITHMAAECADEQSMFWPYHDMLFERQEEWNNLDAQGVADKIVVYALDLSLDIGAFASCMEDPATSQEVYHDRQEGIAYGVTGTPAFFIGNEESGYTLVSGAKQFAEFAYEIERKLES